MPKKSVSTRNSAQRARAKAQKNFELVRAGSSETLEEGDREPAVTTVAATAVATSEVQEEKPVAAAAATKTSASARIAARRQQGATAQKSRVAAPLITVEHYAYVTKDLITIAVLAGIMFVAILVLYFTIGR